MSKVGYLDHQQKTLHTSGLDNGQHVYFTAANVQQVSMNPPVTRLTAFFMLCHNDPFAKTLLYSEVPTYRTCKCE